jgi:hypothetical protein
LISSQLTRSTKEIDEPEEGEGDDPEEEIDEVSASLNVFVRGKINKMQEEDPDAEVRMRFLFAISNML